MWAVLLLSSLLSVPVTAQESGGEPPGASDAPPLIALPVAAPPAAISPPSSRPTPTTTAPAPPEREHLGLFVHLDLGGAYLRTTGSRGDSSFGGQGGALGGAIAVGWSPSEEWALALEFWDWKALSPSPFGESTSAEVFGLGLNVTRYIVPVDLFASVVVSATRLAITDYSNIENAHSDVGFGLKVLLGKEWRVTPWLGLGVGVEFYLSVNRAEGQTLRTLGTGLVFSWTAH